MRLRAGVLIGCVTCLGFGIACVRIPGLGGLVLTTNRLPVADAGGDRIVVEEQTVELDGSSSWDPDGDVLTHAWRQVAGPAVVLVNANTAELGFRAPSVQTETALTFQLVVADPSGLTGAALATVTVTARSALHVVAGEDQAVARGDAVTLNGKGFGGVGELTFRWRQTVGPEVALSEAGSASVTFTAPNVDDTTTLTFELAATDGEGQSAVDTVNVTVYARLTALAGDDQTVSAGASVTLQGLVVGATGTPTYLWRQTGPTGGPNVTLSDADLLTATFTAPDANDVVTLTFELSVTDQAGASDADTVGVTVYPSLDALAGDDQNVLGDGNTVVTLNGSAFGGIGERTYQWTQTDDEREVTLVDANSATATFTTPVVYDRVELEFRLTVTDETGQSAFDRVAVSAFPGFTAVAGDDQATASGRTVTLAGWVFGATGNTTYQWTQLDPNEDPNVTLSDANAATTTFTAPDVTDPVTLTFKLTATDETPETDVDTVDVVVVNTRPVRFSTTLGDFVIILRSDKAPKSVENFMKYIDRDFYKQLTMHRIVPDFIVQGGGYYPDLRSKEALFPGIELESDNGLTNIRGSVAYARTSDPNSAASEFYVNLVDNPSLDHSPTFDGYAVFGVVVEGMDVIDQMAKVRTHSVVPPDGSPDQPFEDVPVEAIVINAVTVE